MNICLLYAAIGIYDIGKNREDQYGYTYKAS